MTRLLLHFAAACALLLAVSAFAAKPAAPAKPAKKPAVATAKLKIEGMTCQNCASTVTRTLSRMAGVKDVKVNAATKIGTVRYDPATVRREYLIAAVKRSGFKAKFAN